MRTYLSLFPLLCFTLKLSAAFVNPTCTETVLQPDPRLLPVPLSRTRTLAFRSILEMRQLDSHAVPASKALF